jgi:hypothetical protein
MFCRLANCFVSLNVSTAVFTSETLASWTGKRREEEAGIDEDFFPELGQFSLSIT